MKKKLILCFFLIFYFVVCNTAIGEQNSNRITRRQEYWILLVQNESGLLGYYDIESGFYQEPVYTSIFDNPDYDAPILAERDGLWGYINRTTGEEIIPFQFTATSAYSDFQNGYAVIGYSTKTNNSVFEHFILIDTYGNQIAMPDGYSIVSGVCGKKKSNIIYGRKSNNYYGYGIYQIDKGFVLEPMYYTNNAPIPYFSYHNGTSSLRIDGYYEVYNEQGRPIYIFIDNNRNCFTVFDVNNL